MRLQLFGMWLSNSISNNTGIWSWSKQQPLWARMASFLQGDAPQNSHRPQSRPKSQENSSQAAEGSTAVKKGGTSVRIRWRIPSWQWENQGRITFCVPIEDTWRACCMLVTCLAGFLCSLLWTGGCIFEALFQSWTTQVYKGCWPPSVAATIKNNPWGLMMGAVSDKDFIHRDLDNLPNFLLIFDPK